MIFQFLDFSVPRKDDVKGFVFYLQQLFTYFLFIRHTHFCPRGRRSSMPRKERKRVRKEHRNRLGQRAKPPIPPLALDEVIEEEKNKKQKE